MVFQVTGTKIIFAIERNRKCSVSELEIQHLNLTVSRYRSISKTLSLPMGKVEQVGHSNLLTCPSFFLQRSTNQLCF